MDWIGALRDDATNTAAFEAALQDAAARADWEEMLQIAEAFAGPDVARWERTAAALESVAAGEVAAGARSTLLKALGDIWTDRLERDDQAIQHYQAAFKVDRGNAEAIERARSLYQRQQNWTMVQRLHQVQIRVTQDPEERARLLTEAGRVQRDRLRDNVGATDYFDQALRAVPGYEPALSALAGEDEAVDSGELDSLRARLASAKGPLRAELLYQIAEILLASDVDDDDPTPYIEEAVSLEPASPEGMRVVADHLRRREAHGELVDVLERIAQSSAPPVQRADAALEAAELARRVLKDPAREEAALHAGLSAEPAHTELVDAAVAFYERREQWDAVASVLERALTRGSGGATDVARYRRLGAICAEQLGDLDRAERHYRRVRMLNGSDDEMLDFYIAYHRQRGEPRKLLAALQGRRERSSNADDMRRCTVQMAEVAEQELDDAVRAVDVWSWYLREHPEDAEGRAELRRLLKATGRWNRLLEVLKEDLRNQADAPLTARIALQLEVARIYRDHVQLPMFEAQAYQAVLALDPAQPEAVAVVRDRLCASQRWLEAATLLDRAAETTEDPALTFAWASEAGTMWVEHAEDLAAAQASFELALEARPDDATTLKTLEVIALEQGDAERRLSWVRQRANLLPADERVAALVEVLGEELRPRDRRGVLADLVDATRAHDRQWIDALALSLREAGEPEREAALWARHLTTDAAADAYVAYADALRACEDRASEAAEAYAEAASRLSDAAPVAEGWMDVLARARRWDDLESAAAAWNIWLRAADRLAMEARGTGDPELFKRAARMAHHELDDPGRAASLLESALELAPDDSTVAAPLADAYAAVGDAEGRAQMLEIQVRGAAGDTKRTLQLELARHALDALDAPGVALGWQLAAFDTDPTQTALRDEALVAARALGRVGAWAAAIRNGAAVLPEGATRREHFAVLATVYEAELDDAQSAIELQERILAETPECGDALQALERLYVSEGLHERAIAVMERQLPLAESEDARERIAVAAAAFRVEHLGFEGDAHAHAVASLDRELTLPESFRVLRDALEATKQYPAAAALAAGEAALEPAGSQARWNALRDAAQLELRAAEVWTPRGIERIAELLDVSTSAEASAVVLDWLSDAQIADDDVLRVADLVEPIARTCGRWDRVVAILQERIRLSEPALALAAAREWARVEEHERGHPSRAAAAWQSVVATLPIQLSDAAEAERLARDTDGMDALVRAWERRLSADADDPLIVELARIPEFEAPRRALDRRVRVAIHADPAQIGRWIAAVRAGWIGDGEDARYLSLAEALLADERLGGDVRGKLHAEVGHSLARQGARPEDAFAHLVSACTLGAAVPSTIDDVVALSEALERDADGAAALEAALERVPDAALSASLHHALGRIYRDRLDRYADAVRHYEASVFVVEDPVPALEALDDLHAEAGAHAERAAVLERLAERLSAPESAEVRLEAARVYGNVLEDLPRAIELAAIARREVATDEASALLRAWLRQAERWADLDALLEQIAEATEDVDGRVAALRERARLLEEPLGRRREAVAQWRAVRDALPGDAEALEQLDRLYGALAEPTAQIEVLQERLDAGTDDPLALQRRLAVARFEHGDTGGAVATASALLQEHPQDEGALELLERLVRDARDEGAATLLVDVYRTTGRGADASRICRQLAESEDVAQALKWLERAQRIEFEDNADPQAAFALALERYRRSNGSVPTLGTLRTLARDVDGWRTFAMLLDERFRSNAASDDELRTLLALLQEHDDQPSSVRAVAHAVLERSPDDVEALRLAIAYEPDPAACVSLWFRFVEAAPAHERGAARVQLAEALRAHGSPAEELSVVLDIEAEASDDPRWTERADALLTRLERWPDLLERLERRASAASTDEARATWLLQCAEVLRTHLGNPEAALAATDGAAAAVGATEAVEAEWEALLADIATPPEVATAAALSHIASLEAEGAVHRLPSVISRALPLTAGDARTALRRKLAACHEQNQSPHDAFDAWVAVLREAPDDAAAWQAVRDLASPTERWGEAGEVGLRIAEVNDDAIAPRVLDDAVKLFEAHLDDVDSALRAAREAHARSPSEQRDGEVERLLLRSEDWSAVAAWYRMRAANAESDADAAAALHRAALVLWTQVEDLDAASDALLLAYERDPHRAGLLDDLDAVLSAQARWEVLIGALAQATEVAPEAQTPASVRRLARLRAQELGDLSGAADVLASWVDRMPELVPDLDAAWVEAADWEALIPFLNARASEAPPEERERWVDRLLHLHAEERSDVPAALEEALRYLQASYSPEIHRKALDWAAAGLASEADLWALQGAAERAGDEQAQRQALEVLATMAIRPEDAQHIAVARAELLASDPAAKGEALEVLLEGLQAAPDAAPLWTRALRLADAPDRARRLAEWTVDLSHNPSAAGTARELTFAVGRVALDVADAPELAEPLLQRSFELDPEADDAVHALIDLLRAGERYEELAVLLERAAAQRTGERAVVLLEQLAELTEGPLDDPERALIAWTNLRDVAPTRTGVVDAVARLAERLDRWEVAVEAMHNSAAMATDPAARASLLVRAAVIGMRNTATPSGFIPTLEEAIEANPSDAEARDALISLLTDAGRWAEAADAIESAAIAAPPGEDASWWARLARVRADALHDVEGAIDAAHAAVNAGGGAEASAHYLQLLRTAGRHRELVDEMERRLQAQDVEDRVAIHVEIATIATDMLGDPETAEHHLAAALVAAPDDVSVLVGLARLQSALGKLEAADAHLERAATLAVGPEQAEVLAERGRVLMQQRRRGPALEAFEAAFAIDPENPEMFELLRAAFEQARDWDGLRSLLHRRASEAQGVDAAPYWRRLSVLARVRLKEPTLARMALEEAYAADPDHEETAVQLLRAYIDGKEPDEALPLVERLTERAERSGGRADLHRLYHLRGRIEEQNEDWIAALDAYQRCFKLDASYVPNLLAMGRMFVQLERYEDGLKVLQTAMMNQMRIKQPSRKLELFYLLGVVRSRTGDPDRARDMFERALQIDRNHAPTLEAVRNFAEEG